jgi:hypothetical protein
LAVTFTLNYISSRSPLFLRSTFAPGFIFVDLATTALVSCTF